jgi:hypothetical protein
MGMASLEVIPIVRVSVESQRDCGAWLTFDEGWGSRQNIVGFR